MPVLRQAQTVVETWIDESLAGLSLIADAAASDPTRALGAYRLWFDDLIATAALMIEDDATLTTLASSVGRGPTYMSNASTATIREGARDAVQRAESALHALKRRLPLFDIPTNGPGEPGRGVFVVHGRDGTAEAAVIAAVERINGARPIVLHEHPGQSRTLIEKLERYGQQIGYAVVIATGDDVGGLQAEEVDLKPRARQNVVFELGYFIGLLGRNRVVLLLEEDVEPVGDIVGINYIPLSGDWQTDLAKEMREAGFARSAELGG